MNIEELLNRQRAFFRSGATLSVDFRLEHLKNCTVPFRNTRVRSAERFAATWVKAILRALCARRGWFYPSCTT